MGGQAKYPQKLGGYDGARIWTQAAWIQSFYS